MTDTPDPELWPCPVCGGEAWTDYLEADPDVGLFGEGWLVGCDGECGDAVTLYATEAEAVAAWNAKAKEVKR
jgi:hypothetical protein